MRNRPAGIDRQATVAVAAAVALVWGCLAGGCSYDSGLDGAECEREGGASEDGSRRCENGFWVRTDAGSVVDSGDRDTAAEDTEPGTDGCSTPSIWYLDEDNDDFGTETETETACNRPPGYVAEKGDCDDTNPDRHPGAAERCNAKDDDCDGETDEMVTRECSAEHDGKGACEPGTEVCTDGSWGDCTGGTDAEPEMCDGHDNDCDGETDEELERDCGTDQGVCESGTEVCTDGSWSECMDQKTGLSHERCDDKDRDCDGQTDNGTCKGVGASCSNDWECATENCRSAAGSSGKKCRQTVFVTDQKTNGDFGGLSGGDAICESAADAAGLGKAASWMAILSNDNTTGFARIDYRYPLYNTDGSLVASDADEFWKPGGSGVALQNPILFDAFGNTNTTDVWTGTKADQEDDKYCDDDGAWTDNTTDEEGTYGVSNGTDETWVDQDKKKCDQTAALYCVQVP